MSVRQVGKLLIAAAIGAGCMDDAPVNSHGGIPLDEMAVEIAKSVCPRAYECCTPMQMMDNKQAGTDEATCEAETTASFKNTANALGNSQRKGRLVYRGDKLAACLAHIRAAACKDLNRTNHFSGVDCEPWIEPRISSGGPCGMDGECIDGFCRKEPMAAEGTCVAFSGVGGSCAEPARCGKALSCDATTFTCFQPLAEGDACTQNAQCASGNCGMGAGGARTCGAPGTGNTCFYSSACALGPGGPPTPLALAVLPLLIALRTRRRRG